MRFGFKVNFGRISDIAHPLKHARINRITAWHRYANNNNEKIMGLTKRASRNATHLKADIDYF